MSQSGESIYALLPRPQAPPVRTALFTSKHPGQVSPEAFGGPPPRQAGTMGRPLGEAAERPDAFLRCHSKTPTLPQPMPPSRPKEKLKPPVPARSERPVMGLTTDRDYITANALETIHSTARRPQPEARSYLERPGFGKVPAYLRRNKAAIAAETAALTEFMRLREQPVDGPMAVPMGQEERAELLHHLKVKWAAVNAEYQKLGFVMDIQSKVKRHEAMEATLAEIEADIRTLEAGDVVLVVPDA